MKAETPKKEIYIRIFSLEVTKDKDTMQSSSGNIKFLCDYLYTAI
jgi:hypothetical protein